ncbi:MAG: hypothetical protein IJK49_00615 [Prevotella sp.]|nr:hypothetical protein [Prevotella sp.]
MKHILSLLLLSFLLAAPCLAGEDNVEARQKSPRTLWCMASKDNDLAQLLQSEGFRLKRAATVEAVLSKAPHHAAVLLLGNGTRTVQQLTADNIRMIEQKKLRVFADFAAMPDAETQTREVTVERVVVTEPMGTLKPMDLLTVNRARFISCQPVRPLMVIARVAGFDYAPFGLTDTETFPLVDQPQTNVYTSTACLSEFSKLRLMPEHHWQAFWQWMVGRLLGRDVTFSRWPALVTPAYTATEPLPTTAKKEAVRRGVEWFYGAHLLVHPSWADDYLTKYERIEPPVGPAVPVEAPCGDGSNGILEGHCSAIDADGHQAYRYSIRADVQGESAMALTLASRLLGNEEYKRVAQRLLDFAVKVCIAGPRNDPKSPSYGLVSWTTNYINVYYGDDNARFLLGALIAAHLMGEHRWDKKLRDAIDANFLTTGKNGFRGARLEDADIQKNGRQYYADRDLINPHPHYESWMWAVYLWLYSQTHEEKYLDLSRRGIALTMKAYPDGWRWTNGIQQERARMVLPLAWLYRVEPMEEHLAWLQTIIADIKANQQPSGAIREELGDPAKGDFGGPRRNSDYGRYEAPLIFKNGDPVVDMLYTSNFAIFGLNEAARATGDKTITHMANSLADFLVRIQARSKKCRDIDGAWYRAFNYRDWNWWASNSDAGWGNLGTLAGWTQSWIVGTLAMMQMNTSYWELTH